MHYTYRWLGAAVAAAVLLPGCQQPGANPTANAADSTQSAATVAQFRSLFQRRQLPVALPDPKLKADSLPSAQIGMYTGFIAGKGKLFAEDGAYLPYLRFTPANSRNEVLVLVEERGDGTYYWLCLVDAKCQLLDKQVVAFTRLAPGTNHDRTAVVSADGSVSISETRVERTVARDAEQLRRMGRPVIEQRSTQTYRLQILPDGKLQGQLPPPEAKPAQVAAG